MAVPPQNAAFASASLYVGDLVQEVTEALLFEIFNAVGPVASVRVCRDAATRRSLGYAYVNFHRVEDAERALDTMNYSAIRGKPCRIMWSHRDPSLRRSGAGNIFVKNLAKNIDNKQLNDTFSMFGNILSCKVQTDAKGESLGYGFVHYESDESAQTAIERVNGMMIGGEKVAVMPFKSKEQRGGFDNAKFTNVYLKNLPEDYSEEKFLALLREYGEITSHSLPRSDGGKIKGFGFANYANFEEAAGAVEALNGMEIGENVLYAGRAQKKAEREKDLKEKFEQMKLERQKKYDGVNLYVKNISDDVDDEKLREMFNKFGTITSAKVMCDGMKKSKGFGFVCFSSSEEATKAVTEMNGRMVNQKPLYVALAQRKEVRRAQLEAHHAARAKIPQPQMYPQGGPMFYNGMHAQRYFHQQMLPRGWNPATGPRPLMRPQQVNYQLMPAGNMQTRPNPQQRGRGRGRNQKTQPNGAVRGPHPAMPPPGMPPQEQAPLTVAELAAAPKDQQKQMIGERLFPLIHMQKPQLAGKITGMLLEMDNGELLHLLENEEALGEKIQEALAVLEHHEADTMGKTEESAAVVEASA